MVDVIVDGDQLIVINWILHFLKLWVVNGIYLMKMF